MEKHHKLNHTNEFQPVARGTHGFGIPQNWIREIDVACTNWLRKRGLYSDDIDWRYQLDKRVRLRAAQKKAERFDAFIDKLSEQN